MRGVKVVIVTLSASAISLGARAAPALADSDAPPSEIARTSNTGTVIFVGLCIALVVLVSFLVLRSMPRKRSREDHDHSRRAPGDPGTRPRADEEPEDSW